MNENEITIEAYRLLYTPEYIEREAAFSSLCCDCSAKGDCRPGERCTDYMRLKEIPAADVRPVKWISTKERLPEDGAYVIGRYKNNDMAVVCVFEHDEDLVFWRAMVEEGWETECDSGPTHWMPLPAPPTEETEA